MNKKNGIRMLVYVAIAFAAFGITMMAYSMKNDMVDAVPYSQDKQPT